MWAQLSWDQVNIQTYFIASEKAESIWSLIAVSIEKLNIIENKRMFRGRKKVIIFGWMIMNIPFFAFQNYKILMWPETEL